MIYRKFKVNNERKCKLNSKGFCVYYSGVECDSIPYYDECRKKGFGLGR